MIDYKRIKEYACGEGFDLCGVARCRTMEEQREPFMKWLEAGYHGEMSYMERNIEARLDPSLLVPGAHTVIVCAVSYNFGIHKAIERAGVPRVSSYALANDYHAVIKGMLSRMLARLQADDPQLRGRCFVDSAPILEKAWAMEAGVGWAGKNSLLITQEFGSFVLLGEIVATSKADRYDEPYRRDLCGACVRCIERCPTGAIRAPKSIDANRCISALTIEEAGADGAADVQELHGWIFGCDECMKACPYNHHPAQARFQGLRPIVDPTRMDAAFWRGLSQPDFERMLGSTPLMRCGLERIKARL